MRVSKRLKRNSEGENLDEMNVMELIVNKIYDFYYCNSKVTNKAEKVFKKLRSFKAFKLWKHGKKGAGKSQKKGR